MAHTGRSRRSARQAGRRRPANQFPANQFGPTNFGQPIQEKDSMKSTNKDTEKMTVRVAFALDVNVARWCREYHMQPDEVSVDVASYASTAMHELHAVNSGLASIRQEIPEPPRGTAGDGGGLLVPLERLQGLWDELREMYTVLVRTPAPKEMSMGLGWACLAYSRIVGLELAHVQEYLQADWPTAPTKPPGVAASALSAPLPEGQ